MQIESVTDKGLRREDNEDRYLVDVLDDGRVLLVIADGMGGHAAGEIAAQLAVDSFEGFCPPDREVETELSKRIQAAHRRILEYSRQSTYMKGMGTTLTALFMSGGSGFWAHVGDTRIYHLHGGELSRLTDDHTIPGNLLKDGKITKEQARLHPYANVLTKCAGCERHEPDSGMFDLARGDLVLLSTDGLHDLMDDTEIELILKTDIPIREKLDRMIARCLEAGGRDNITGVLAAV
jgi:protein phosphatase